MNMRRIFRITFRTLLFILLIATIAGIWNRDKIRRLVRVNSLFSEELIVSNFSNMESMFFHEELSVAGDTVAPLPSAPQPLPEYFTFEGAKVSIADWRVERQHTAMVVLKDGQVAFEGYFLGTKDTDRRISWSMAKSVLSTAFGVAVEEGLITDLDAPVIRYVPNLAGSAYEDATIRHVLNMASGVEFDEDYLDFNSDINRMGRVLALGRSMDGFAENLTKSARPPGSGWQYTSIDTHVLGMVLRSATGMSAKEYVSDKILRPMGLEANPTYLTDGYGVAFVLGGLNMRTRDYARFGLMMAQDGNLNGNQIVPREWVRASTKQSAPAPAPDHDTNLGYGYQWWLPPDAQEGEFLAKGIYGQYIYVNRPKGVVIALNSADRDWTGTDRDITHMNLTMFRAIADGLR